MDDKAKPVPTCVAHKDLFEVSHGLGIKGLAEQAPISDNAPEIENLGDDF